MPPAPSAFPEPAAAAPPRRWFHAWWGRQSPARQDRLATLAPLASVLLFLVVIISAFWYLRNEEIERETESVKHAVELTQAQFSLRLNQHQEELARIARELGGRGANTDRFMAEALAFTRERPEVTRVVWLGPGRETHATLWGLLTNNDSDVPAPASAPAAASGVLQRDRTENDQDEAFRAARSSRQPAYSGVFTDHNREAVFQVHVPIVDQGQFAGTLLAEYSLPALLRHLVPPEVTRRHVISIVDLHDRALASTVTRLPGERGPAGALLATAPLVPASNGLLLRAEGYRTGPGFVANTLFWMVAALSLLTLWMLLGAWRHMRTRSRIQSALVAETNFRRAMENSILTGMRAMDLDGRISYVNAAFCQMTGFAESDLVGRLPPYPYWPPERVDENSRLLKQELQGRSPIGGIEVKVMRKDGTVFDARMYVSPLIDPKNHQTGWMTSITNITDAKRVRDQLSASHERFTTVLEGLDASVSVLLVQTGELLFTNRLYRLWFGADARGHALLAGSVGALTLEAPIDDDVDNFSGLPTHELTEADADPREVFVESLQKWFDVRARYVQWTDGRLAQMLIATDITARVRAEEQSATQAEKAQVTARLVTMGEMASSVAHELNQPLTAITNYCNGMVSRVRANSIAPEDLVAALQKTARQAERAGQIIHRIRQFVKRSEPQRQPADAKQIVDAAVDLAGIELRRRSVAIHTYVAQRLPVLQVDPILIEQVLLNLLKNAAEAIDGAQLPPARRHIELRVVPRHHPEEGEVIEFSVTDMGPGLKEDVIDRLYEAFFSTKAEGLGIGLSLCRSIVESHRGRMKAQNLYNGSHVVGCRFAFTLPVEPAPVEAAPTESAGALPPANPTVTSEASE